MIIQSVPPLLSVKIVCNSLTFVNSLTYYLKSLFKTKTHRQENLI